MSKKFKSQASSSRAASGAFGGFGSTFGGFSSEATAQGSPSSSLSYIAEPPDLSKISQPHVVVSFKNLLKKDTTTKTKALEDLQDFLSAQDTQSITLEDGLIEAWIKIYPRISIDTSRRVRQLAHILQGRFVSLSGRRIARFIPKVIGAWLAGLYDNDKLVFKAAQESVIRAFPTEEKRQSLWKVYQSAIFEFIIDAVLHQTPQTLSDERTVRPDEAEAKHARVVATAIQVFNQLLARASAAQLEKDSDSMTNLLGNKSLWSFAYHEDPFVRRSVYDLLRTSLSVDGNLLEWKTISTCFLSKALSKSQLGSAYDFSDMLLTLTREHPQIWTSDYSGKVSATKRLYQYIKTGSEGANSVYWENLHLLFKSIPIEIMAPKPVDDDTMIQDATNLLEVIHDSLLNREEQRGNLGDAWGCFVDTAFWMSTLISEKTTCHKFLQSQISPILEQYVVAQSGNDRWTLQGKFALELCAKSFVRMAELAGKELLLDLWARLSDQLIHAMRISSPEKSNGFRDSQDSICAQAKRLFALEARILGQISESSHLSFITNIFQDAAVPLVRASLELLRSRKGKPYGAASMIDEAVVEVPHIITDFDDLEEFLSDDAPDLLFSPSSDRLISILFSLRHRKCFGTVLGNFITAFLQSDLGTSTLPGLQKLFSCITSDDITVHPKLGLLITKDLDRALKGSREAWTDITIITNNSGSQNGISLQILNSIVDVLSADSTIREALYGLFQISLQSPDLIRTFIGSQDGSRMVSKLLYITESSTDEIAQLAESLQNHIKDIIKGESSARSAIEIVQQNFSNVGKESLSIDSLVQMAEEVLGKASVEDKPRILSRLLPTREQWKQALDPLLQKPLRMSGAIINALGGAVFLTDRSLPASLSKELDSIPRDPYRFSSAIRLTFFVTKVLASNGLEYVEPSLREVLFFYLPLGIQLVDDDVSLEGSKALLDLDIPDIRDECADLVSEGRLLIRDWIQSPPGPAKGHEEELNSYNLFSVWEQQLESLQDDSPKSYNIAETFARVSTERDSVETIRSAESCFNMARRMDGPSNPFVLPAVVAAFKDSIAATPSGMRLCNELISDVTGFKIDKELECLRKIATLNLLIQGENNIARNVPKPRLVFLVKRLIACLESESPSPGLVSEILKLLANVFPLIKEIYGSHWTSGYEILQESWSKNEIVDESLPVLHSSLRLFACLKSLATTESNDDLEDAWATSQKSHSQALIQLLSQFDSSLNYDQPLKITADLLSRLISSISVDHVEDVNDLFSILAVPNRGIQRAAYDVLHRAIPKLQEAVSLDVALSDAVATLPDELISLLVEAPTMNALREATVDDSVWVSLRCYILSWKTLFDHFINASLPVQEAYVTNIKENDCLNPFLEFMFDFLQHPSGKLVDVSKIDIRSFNLDESEPAEKETQSLFVHLYYLCLKYLPNMTKVWWIDSKKRVKGQVEAWTEKYISPLVIEDSLQSVTEWFSAQDFTGEEQPLQVKVSPRTAEIIASIEVDEESPPTSVAISLPPTYPLQQALVDGRARIAVDEKKWRSWLLTIQGVIMFSNGNLIDGLLAFRKNVQGALKGQTECAICYSVISTNMQTPNKKCATCKNTFHSDCLFRWFKSSNASSCPLCRNNFPYS
ncbi:hypothetical protein FQN52_003125 [Onygenales sp. PD_12]|nr:hypothetical protein FQN52_003125 [Onygenales sp. PD_12]